MKKLVLLFVFSCSTFIFPNVSYAEWIKVAENQSGDEYYLDFKQIRKSNGYVYYWQLTNYIKPNSEGNLSSTIYVQGDCNVFRYAYLSLSFHNKPMGKGYYAQPFTPKFQWTYPRPNSVTNGVLKRVCDF